MTPSEFSDGILTSFTNIQQQLDHSFTLKTHPIDECSTCLKRHESQIRSFALPINSLQAAVKRCMMSIDQSQISVGFSKNPKNSCNVIIGQSTSNFDHLVKRYLSLDFYRTYRHGSNSMIISNIPPNTQDILTDLGFIASKMSPNSHLVIELLKESSINQVDAELIEKFKQYQSNNTLTLDMVLKVLKFIKEDSTVWIYSTRSIDKQDCNSEEKRDIPCKYCIIHHDTPLIDILHKNQGPISLIKLIKLGATIKTNCCVTKAPGDHVENPMYSKIFFGY